MKKAITLLTLTLLLLLTACSCKHEWKEATCTTPKTCSLCNETEGEPLGHKFENATCVLPEMCSICNTENGEALGHAIVIDAAVEPTCTKSGLTEGSHCEVCDEIIIPQKDISKLEHTKGKWELTDEATLTDEGTETMYCSVCEAVIDSRDTDKKTPCIVGSSFNFTDDEFIDWIEESSSLEFTLIYSGDKNSTYAIHNTTTDGTGILLLNHRKGDRDGNICLIAMHMYDDNLQAMKEITYIGEQIDSRFSSDDSFEKLYYDKTYTSANMTTTMLELMDDCNFAVLTPYKYLSDILS